MLSAIHSLELTPALAFALAHGILLVLLQCENYLLYATPPGQRLRGLGRLPLLLPQWQTEKILLLGALAGAVSLAAPTLLGRWLFFASYTVLTVFVVLEQLYYKRFFDHVRLSLVPSTECVSVRWICTSVWYELDWVFPFNVAAASACLTWLASVLVHAPAAELGLSLPLAAGAGLLLLAGLPALFSGKHSNLQRHPVLVLLTDLCFQRWLARRAKERLARLPREEVARVEPTVGISVDTAVAAAATAMRRQTRRPNVILVVLESVGGLAMFGDRTQLSAADTPQLAELSKHAVLFPAVYSFYPGSTRTYVPLETGGVHAGLEPDWEARFQHYQGPTLARYFGAHGYRTALFSSSVLSSDGMDKLGQSMGYETFVEVARDREQLGHHNMIHWWGALEERTVAHIEQWLRDGADQEAPFFLLYWTTATHHPYGSPPHYPAPFAGDDLPTRYRNALHYTDAALGQLVRALQTHGLWDSTILAITGDHGEAFGTLHPRNFYHAQFLYEENVRSFLMLANTALNDGPIVSTRHGQCADILPTLASVAGLPVPEVCGKDLCAMEFAPRFVFFFTLTGREAWGLRDGHWKFVQGIRDGVPELYDLSADPTEQWNLAAQHPERVAGYGDRCREWFVRVDEDFRAQCAATKRGNGQELDTPPAARAA